MPGDHEPEADGVGALGTGTLRAASMMRCARCDISQVPSGPGACSTGPHGAAGSSASSIPARSAGDPGTAARADGRPRAGRAMMAAVSTRTLLILAAITGVAILAAGAVQILLAR